MLDSPKELCPHLTVCGACPQMHKPYLEQLGYKKSLVNDAFLASGFTKSDLATVLKDCVSSPKTFAYRNKAKWVLSSQNGSLAAGIYAQGSHDVVPIPNCVVHGPRINELTEFLRRKIVELNIPVYSAESPMPGIRYAIVRYSFFQKKSMLVLVTSQQKIPGLSELVSEFVEKFQSELVSVVQNINKSSGNAVLGSKNKYLFNQGELLEKFGPYSVLVGPLSFLQVNTSMAEVIYKKVKSLIGKGPHKIGIDLYSGMGLMGMYLAKQTERVIAIEELRAASEAGLVSARRNGITNIHALCGDVMELLDPSQFPSGAVDWLVLNPPRKGCEKGVLKKVSQLAPRRLVYVSCNPKTLARDCQVLLKEGFQLKTVEPYDMFPQTEHVETVVLLERAKKLSR